MALRCQGMAAFSCCAGAVFGGKDGGSHAGVYASDPRGTLGFRPVQTERIPDAAAFTAEQLIDATYDPLSA